MILLVDTHAVLWFWRDDPQLSGHAKALIQDPANLILVSRAVPWEVAIKVSLKKIDILGLYAGFFRHNMTRSRFGYLETRDEHLDIVADLPLHHKDPFDRLMIAQSLCEQIPIISIDSKFDAYGVTRIWD
jgi:PIN domain nuclease of toxin-antitoxin system